MLQAYKRVLDLIPQRIWLGSDVARRYSDISSIGSIINEAAAAAVESQAYDLALEWLEEGSSIVWKQMLQLRSPLAELRSANPMLADELETSARQLEDAGTERSTQLSSGRTSHEVAAQTRRRLAEKYEKLLHEARNLPGFGDFMRPKGVATLCSATQSGAVVVVNVFDTSCDALVMLPGSDSILHVPLPNFTHRKATQASAQLAECMHTPGSRRGAFRRHKPSPETVLKSMLTMLWLDVVKPVLDHLGYTVSTPHDCYAAF